VTTPNPPQPGPQQPYPGPPTQPQGYPAGPGAPGAGPQPGYPPAPPQQKKKFPVRIVVGLVIAAVVIVGVFVGKQLTGDPDTAGVGDCMAGSSAENLKVVKCTDAKAQYKVVGKVENKSQTDFSINSAGICKAYPTAESAFWKGERGGKGYVLCLGPNK
jgi:hypothetical protein